MNQLRLESSPVKEISYRDCYDLRLKVLKRKEWDYDYQYAGDDDQTTFHLGIYRDNQLVTIASFFANSNEHIQAQNPVQLRGMATDYAFQGQGFGRVMIQAAISELTKRKHDVLWCNAREEAVNFYEKIGFKISSARFEIPRVGPHFIMYIRIDS